MSEPAGRANARPALTTTTLEAGQVMATSHPIPTHARFQDLTGRAFDRLAVIDYAGARGGHQFWRCRCSCGRTCAATANNLLRGHTRSCGCRKAEIIAGGARRRHSGSRTPEWTAWQHMKGRCYDAASRDYPNYGGRGISVCERWLACFDNFIADMGRKPSPELTLDRIDNDGPYCPENCRWATRSVQTTNKRLTRRVTLDGVTKTVHEWCEQYHTGPHLVVQRLRKGWEPLRALTTPPRPSKRTTER
jgi:hypothetical protein